MTRRAWIDYFSWYMRCWLQPVSDRTQQTWCQNADTCNLEVFAPLPMQLGGLPQGAHSILISMCKEPGHSELFSVYNVGCIFHLPDYYFCCRNHAHMHTSCGHG
ncbi:hypothetical protein GOODEAATRI_016913 [Goodea atripinnis]|uniref:Uncharacterized protein n=1 Tax=Goodea atripinnis TaxID=208336 RepID=A0ABV0N248_9TELE